jgi:phenylpropionate dioxygenase-like ring-hydroxylating dioxygenase large terminal subunit
MNNSINDLINNYKTGFSLPQPFYTSQEIFDLEWQTIWKANWIFAATIADIPKQGDYVVYNILNESIIIIRGNNGEVYAHYNTCTHRGSIICQGSKGNAAKLICPYHQWVFDKDGRLLNARMMPDDFCKEHHNLHSVNVQVAEGLIFICMAKVAPDFSNIKQSLEPYLKPYQLNKSKIAIAKQHILKANWKLIGENFRECYHCGGAHPEYCNAVIAANLVENADALIAEKQEVWNAKGLATNLVEIENGNTSYAVRYPLRPGFESYSIDAKKISTLMGSHTDYDAGVVGLVNYPNFWMDAVSDYAWTMKLTPISPSQTLVDFCWLIHENAVEGKDYTLDRLTEFWDKTGAQDGLLCENNFKGIETSAYQPGPYAPVEDQVINFVDWCVAQMKIGLK